MNDVLRGGALARLVGVSNPAAPRVQVSPPGQVPIPPTPRTRTPAELPSIPDYVPTRPAASDINDMSRVSTEMVAASNSVIPPIYGRDRVFGKPIVVHINDGSGYLYVAYAFCRGPIEAIDALFIDGVNITDATNGILARFPDTAYNVYLGTTDQGVDPMLAAEISGFADAYTTVPVAYVVFRFPRGSTSSFPRCEAIIRGLKVYDPRKDDTRTDITPAGSGNHRLNDPTTWEYSENPTLCFADFAVRKAGWSVLWQGIVDNANANDQILSNGEVRRTIGLSLLEQRPADDWVRVFRMYMSAFVVWEGSFVRVIPDAAIPDLVVARHYTPDLIVEGSVRVFQRSIRNYPTVIVLEYRDSSTENWRMAKVTVEAEGVGVTIPRRVSKISLPGIHRATQAKREAYQRLNSFVSDINMEMEVFDEGFELQVGSVISVTYSKNLNERLFRVMRISGGNGRWRLLLNEYDPNMYSDDVSGTISYNITNVVSVIGASQNIGGGFEDTPVVHEIISTDPDWDYVTLLVRVDNNQLRDLSRRRTPLQVVNNPAPTPPILSGEIVGGGGGGAWISPVQFVAGFLSLPPNQIVGWEEGVLGEHVSGGIGSDSTNVHLKGMYQIYNTLQDKFSFQILLVPDSGLTTSDVPFEFIYIEPAGIQLYAEDATITNGWWAWQPSAYGAEFRIWETDLITVYIDERPEPGSIEAGTLSGTSFGYAFSLTGVDNGVLMQTPLKAYNHKLYQCYSYQSWTGSQDAFVFAIYNTSMAVPAGVFTSVSFTDRNGVPRTFLAAEADEETTGSGWWGQHRQWVWYHNDGDLFEANETYPIQVIV